MCGRGRVLGPQCDHGRTRRELTIAAATVIALGLGSHVAFGTAEDPAAAAAARAAPQMKPPVIAEPFTVLACAQNSTIGMEGCEEHKLVGADKRIDREVRLLFTILPDSPARRRLAQAETARFAYRQADSRSRGDIYEGGSESPVASLATTRPEVPTCTRSSWVLNRAGVTCRRSRRSRSASSRSGGITKPGSR